MIYKKKKTHRSADLLQTYTETEEQQYKHRRGNVAYVGLLALTCAVIGFCILSAETKWDGGGDTWSCSKCGTSNYRWEMSCGNCGNRQ